MSSVDPLGLLGTDSPSPAPIKQESTFGKLFVGLLVGVASVLAYQHFSPNFEIPWEQEGDREEQVSVDKNLLLFVHERKNSPLYQDLVLRELTPEYLGKVGVKGFRALDDDLEDAPVPALIQYAQTKGVSPPFVVLTNSEDRPVKAASFPKDKEELEKFLR